MTQVRVVAAGLMIGVVLGIGALLPGAASAKVTDPGFVGAPNCTGRFTAFIAQGNLPGVPGPGIGNAARQFGVTVQDGRVLIIAACTDQPAP